MTNIIKDVKYTVALDNYQLKIPLAERRNLTQLQHTYPDLISDTVHVAVDLILRFGTNYNYYTGYIWETCYQWFYEDLTDEDELDADTANDIIQALTEIAYDMFALVVTCAQRFGSLGYTRNDALDEMANMEWCVTQIVEEDTEEIEVVGTLNHGIPY